jgi:hypothetical protein
VKIGGAIGHFSVFRLTRYIMSVVKSQKAQFNSQQGPASNPLTYIQALLRNQTYLQTRDIHYVMKSWATEQSAAQSSMKTVSQIKTLRHSQ